MKKLFRIILLFAILEPSFCQDNSFKKLVDIFESNTDKIIPDSLAKLFFDTETTDWIQSITANEIVFRNAKVIGLAITSHCIAGGVCESGQIRTFTLDGKLIDKGNYELDVATCVLENTRYCIYKSDSLLIFWYTDKEVDNCNEEIAEVVKNIVKLEYVRVVNGEFQGAQEFEINTKRKYFWTSTQFLIERDLKNFTKAELSIMRNEIFAEHGYIFKTSKWQDFFNYQNWYEPKFDNINDKLSLMEKHNIELIYKMEKQKEGN